MIKGIIPVLSFTWLFWLYLSLQLLSLSNFVEESKPAMLLPKTAFSSTEASIKAMTLASLRSQTLIDTSARLEIHLQRRELVLYNGDAKIKSYPIAIGRAG